MAQDLFFLLYRSSAHRTLDGDTVIGILSQSLRNNPGNGLTGFLHVDRNHFLQYLEGPRVPLMRMATRISKDRRHRDFVILAEGTIDERFFPDWDMGQIADENLPSDGILAERSWLNPDAEIDPMPLIQAFASHANHLTGLDISEIE
ncbi:BLUF domain-containing protein [Rhodovulum euryhalinum]|uniref:FAD-dependent sensor of blue light n=1 Tax=Rhodovulum euryhalinum TaxID=35805 RepID=A0A4R2L1Q5_9RHOB|nr:BLUF domain-containing protein [Rhodovulum euryhalinum]TCO72955.1 FAD-dependent sensor of blue light [Rhodovulum euryhalinum]